MLILNWPGGLHEGLFDAIGTPVTEAQRLQPRIWPVSMPPPRLRALP